MKAQFVGESRRADDRSATLHYSPCALRCRKEVDLIRDWLYNPRWDQFIWKIDFIRDQAYVVAHRREEELIRVVLQGIDSPLGKAEGFDPAFLKKQKEPIRSSFGTQGEISSLGKAEELNTDQPCPAELSIFFFFRKTHGKKLTTDQPCFVIHCVFILWRKKSWSETSFGTQDKITLMKKQNKTRTD